MTIAPPPPPAKTLTYEDYLAEDEINRPYDIIGGVRRFMSSPTWKHQRIADKTTRAFLTFEETSSLGLALSAPFDVMIERFPLQTRQPDVLFISHTQLATIGGVPERGAIEAAPELIVEVISDSDRQQVIDDKLADYIRIGVKEAWLAWPETRTVQVFRLTADGPVLAATYSETQSVVSLSFPGLTVAVADIFRT
jgi:Uma2 family endonuclease